MVSPRLKTITAGVVALVVLVACAKGTPVSSRIDLVNHKLSADVPASTNQVFVVAAAPNGEAGSYTATKLSSWSKWSVGMQVG